MCCHCVSAPLRKKGKVRLWYYNVMVKGVLQLTSTVHESLNTCFWIFFFLKLSLWFVWSTHFVIETILSGSVLHSVLHHEINHSQQLFVLCDCSMPLGLKGTVQLWIGRDTCTVHWTAHSSKQRSRDWACVPLTPAIPCQNPQLPLFHRAGTIFGLGLGLGFGFGLSLGLGLGLLLKQGFRLGLR